MTDLLPISDLGAIEKMEQPRSGCGCRGCPMPTATAAMGRHVVNGAAAGAFPYAGSGVGQEVEMYRLGDGSGPANPGN